MSDLWWAITGQAAGYIIMGLLMLQLIPRSVDQWDDLIARVTRFGREPKGRHANRKQAS